MGRKIKFVEGEYYHVFNRGVDKRKIFLNDYDKERFLKLLFLCNSENPFNFRDLKKISIKNIRRDKKIVDIGSYCLMDNHFHILLKEKIEGGISLFLQKLSTAYSMYFNKTNERTGSLFEGNFKAYHANKDEYLKYLFSYVHLNPIKLIDPKWKENGLIDFKKSKKFLHNYKYSSYIDYIGENREESLILNKKEFPKYFDDIEDFNNIVNSWLDLKNYYD